MFTIITLVMVLLGILLIAAVLVQPGKGDMASGMSGFGNQLGSMFGSRKASDLLTKITIGLGAVILLLSLITNKFFMSSSIAEERAPATLNAEKPTNIPAAPAPAKSAPVQAAPVQQSK